MTRHHVCGPVSVSSVADSMRARSRSTRGRNRRIVSGPAVFESSCQWSTNHDCEGTRFSSPPSENTSSSVYRGMPRSVRRRTLTRLRVQPRPTIPFPDPESYVRLSAGCRSARDGVTGRGSERDSVPLAGLTRNCSSIPATAPPPLGSVSAGTLSVSSRGWRRSASRSSGVLPAGSDPGAERRSAVPSVVVGSPLSSDTGTPYALQVSSPRRRTCLAAAQLIHSPAAGGLSITSRRTPT